MGVIWSNTLKASDKSEAEKVLTYAKEHYKKRGLEDYDEQTMCGLEFAEDSLIYTEFRKDRLKVFYDFVDEIGAAFPELELQFLQVGDGKISTEFIYKNRVCTRYDLRLLKLFVADKEYFERLMETAVPSIVQDLTLMCRLNRR